MTNREKYFLKRDEYDLMMTIKKQLEDTGVYCPIRVVGGKKRPCIAKHISLGHLIRDCESCVQEWLNEDFKE